MRLIREAGPIQMDNHSSRPGDCGRYAARVSVSHRFKLSLILFTLLAGCTDETASVNGSKPNEEKPKATTMRDLDCDSATLAGPVDSRVVAGISKRFPLATHFVEHMSFVHGGQPKINAIKVRGKTFHVAEFLTFVDSKSELDGNLRPHFEQKDTDERIVKSVTSVMQCDRNFFLDKFVPFAATQKDMCLDRGYVSFFCLDHRTSRDAPSVVLWDAHAATDEYFEIDSRPDDRKYGLDGDFKDINWDSFIYPVADSYREFVQILKPPS